MKTIGLIGGLSWESSSEYYRIINQVVRERLGGVHSAQCLLWSFDFAEIEALQAVGEWDAATARMIDAARRLERGGADCLVICSNTMHRMADEVQGAVDIPLLHIADPTGRAIQSAGVERVGLIATRYTMEGAFYRRRLVEKFGLDVRVPPEPGRTTIHNVIYHELVVGVIREESRQAYQAVIGDLVGEGAQAIILGCTEIDLLIKPEHSPAPLFDTTHLHALAAVDFALGG